MMLMFLSCGCGGIGRRTGLKIPSLQRREGSSPSTRTKSKDKLYDRKIASHFGRLFFVCVRETRYLWAFRAFSVSGAFPWRAGFPAQTPSGGAWQPFALISEPLLYRKMRRISPRQKVCSALSISFSACAGTGIYFCQRFSAQKRSFWHESQLGGEAS
jgi:hypothetical protein